MGITFKPSLYQHLFLHLVCVCVCQFFYSYHVIFIRFYDFNVISFVRHGALTLKSADGRLNVRQIMGLSIDSWSLYDIPSPSCLNFFWKSWRPLPPSLSPFPSKYGFYFCSHAFVNIRNLKVRKIRSSQFSQHLILHFILLSPLNQLLSSPNRNNPLHFLILA